MLDQVLASRMRARVWVRGTCRLVLCWSRRTLGPNYYAEGDPSMTQISRDSKRKHRNKALPVLSVAGLSVALASAASAVPAGPATDMAGFTPGEGHQITFGEEEISDVTLATFYVFDKENVGGSSEPAVELVGHGHGCGGHGHGCGAAEVPLRRLRRSWSPWLRRLRWLRRSPPPWLWRLRRLRPLLERLRRNRDRLRRLRWLRRWWLLVLGERRTDLVLVLGRNVLTFENAISGTPGSASRELTNAADLS